jgi:hypothetical protein
MHELRGEAASLRDRAVPEPLDDVPRFPEAGGVGGAHLGPVGVAPVKLRVDQRCYVDPVDQEVVDLAVDPGVDQLDTAHGDSGHVYAPEPGAGKVDGAELRTCQVDTLEVRAAHAIPRELSHGPDLGHARRQVESAA